MKKDTKKIKIVPTTQYVGKADANVIESFRPISNNKADLAVLYLRAQANRQRHAIVYSVKLSDNMICKIEKHLKKHNYENALKCLKRCCTKDYEGQYLEQKANIKSSSAESLKLIPNPKLDPYN